MNVRIFPHPLNQFLHCREFNSSLFRLNFFLNFIKNLEIFFSDRWMVFLFIFLNFFYYIFDSKVFLNTDLRETKRRIHFDRFYETNSLFYSIFFFDFFRIFSKSSIHFFWSIQLIVDRWRESVDFFFSRSMFEVEFVIKSRVFTLTWWSLTFLLAMAR